MTNRMPSGCCSNDSCPCASEEATRDEQLPEMPRYTSDYSGPNQEKINETRQHLYEGWYQTSPYPPEKGR